MSFQCYDYISQIFTIGELSEYECHELIQVGEGHSGHHYTREQDN